jgi:hypothetical protein
MQHPKQYSWEGSEGEGSGPREGQSRLAPARAFALTAIAVSWTLAITLPAQAQDAEEDPADQVDSAFCLDCHAVMEGETLEFGDGTSIDLGVDEEAWNQSVHAHELDCNDCHRQIYDFPHPELPVDNARAYQLALAETCNRCHYAYYTRVLDSTHYAQIEAGNLNAPTCVDCHGAHAITNPHRPRIDVDRRCARCHGEISAIYEGSVHGRALVEGGNEDVPVCTDCHGAHSIQDPTQPGFHAAEHDICARCHADEERMERYGLSANVLDTYLDDFHGVSNQLYAAGAGSPGQAMASCTDCHGVHDIQRFDRSGSREEIRARVADLCRKCHQDVPEEFADAWLSHYEPTLSSAPLVWAVTWSYRILIPLIMLGLVLHILLDLWRMRTHRWEDRP